MGGKLLLIAIIALAAYGFGFMVAVDMNTPPQPPSRGEAAGRAVVTKPMRSEKPVAGQSMTPGFDYVPPEVRAGQVATVSVRALPGQVCTLWFVNPVQPQQSLPIPIYQTSGPDGRCSWQWNIPTDARSSIATVWVWAGGGTPIQQSFHIRP